ncbi:MAG: hypothetical protein CMM91_08045 [Rickettsiales bacterium]|nr:hypothetical protein [Rickettsiales bacterium]
MLLTIDIGNTNIMFSLFKDFKIKKIKRFKKDLILSRDDLMIFFKLLFKIKNLEAIMISSVVPELNNLFKHFFLKEFKISPIFINEHLNSLDFKTNIKDKRSIGADRIVNVIYSKSLVKCPIMIIDFGTATTVDYVNSEGVYEGGIISPGIDLSLKSLHQFTSKLPLVKFEETKNIIGNTTKSAIQSGFFWGYVSMINGFIKLINKEKNIKSNLILTGGNCSVFTPYIKNIFLLDEHLSMRGLNFLFGELKKSGK